MQTVDVQHDIQQVNYTEAVKQGNPERKEEIHWKGASFFEMLHNLMADDADGALTGAELSGLDAESMEKAAEKTNAAMRTELARLKSKSRVQTGKAQHSTGADAQLAESTGIPADGDAVLTAGKGFAEKNTLESGEKLLLKNMLTAQAETDTATAQAAVESSSTAQQVKKQKNGKIGAESAAESALATASSTAELFGKQKKNTDEAASDTALEKSTKIQQPKQQKPVFTVVDERTVHAAPVTADGSVHEAGSSVRVSNTPSVDMAADFRGMAAGLGSSVDGTQAAKESSAPSFASLVAQQVQDMAPDFVQAGRIVLQDNNAGIIRLQMQPAHLGSVKINLELVNGKKIVGKIITGSKEAYEAFKESIDQLSKAFEQGGFASAQFDISWSGEGGSRQSGEDSGQFNELFAKKSRSEVMQNNRYADTETVYAFGQDQAVNVFA